MKPERGSGTSTVDDAFYTELRSMDPRFDLLGKSIEYRSGSGGVIDILFVDVDDLYVEFIDIPEGSVWSRYSYNTLGRGMRELDDDWTYRIDDRGENTSFLHESPSIEGNIYFDSEDESKLRSREFQDFSDEILGYDLLEEAERITDDSLDI